MKTTSSQYSKRTAKYNNKEYQQQAKSTDEDRNSKTRKLELEARKHQEKFELR